MILEWLRFYFNIINFGAQENVNYITINFFFLLILINYMNEIVANVQVSKYKFIIKNCFSFYLNLTCFLAITLNVVIDKCSCGSGCISIFSNYNNSNIITINNYMLYTIFQSNLK